MSKDLEKILERLSELLPPPPPQTDWAASVAFRWRPPPTHPIWAAGVASGWGTPTRRGAAGGSAAAGWLQPVRHVHKIRLSDLRGIDKQIERVEQNTHQFIDGKPANNVLLTGARGT